MAAEFLERMGERIRERRETMGLSRAELARRMPGKVNENQIYRWEGGKHQPHSDTLEALAEVLECDVSYFMAASPTVTETPPMIAVPEPSQLDRIEAKLDQLLAAVNQPDEDASPIVQRALERVREAHQRDPANTRPDETPVVEETG